MIHWVASPVAYGERCALRVAPGEGMFRNGEITLSVLRAIIVITLFSGPGYGRATGAQEGLSPTISRLIPRLVERLNSADVIERVGVLDELVIVRRDSDVTQLLFRYDLPASDYSAVVKSILAGNLQEVEGRRASEIWWKINHVVRVSRLKELIKPVVGYLPKSGPHVQLGIMQTLKTLGVLEGVPEMVMLLRAPEEYIRREALDTLVSLRAREAVPALVTLLKDKDALKRYYALIGLVTVNGREAAPAIAGALEDESEDNRYWALDALVKLDAREYARELWKLTGDGQRHQTEAYALAALVSFDEPRAIPLAVSRATDGDLTRRTEMLEFLVKVKANAIAPALVAVLESRAVLGGNPADVGTDSNVRRDIMTCLGMLGARGAIPVLRDYARGRDSNTFLQRAAVMTLGTLAAKEAVPDLLPLLDERVTGDAYATAEAGVALAQISDRRTWPQLIALAARPACPYRSEIISELNRHLDPEMWERIRTQKVTGLYVKSVKATVEAFARESGIRIVLDYLPGRDSSPRTPVEGDRYPWANTSVNEISLSDGLRGVIEGLSDGRTPRPFTFIFDDKGVHILSVERAVAWWREQVLPRVR